MNHALNNPKTTENRKTYLLKESFLRRIYEFWYHIIIQNLPIGDGKILEIGSGGGFLKEKIPTLITSDAMPLPGVDQQIHSSSLPFDNCELKAIVGTNVLHHLPEIWKFLFEADRVLQAGGRLNLS